MSEPIDKFTVLIRFLNKYQQYLGGKQHVEGEPFHMIDYIYGVQDDGIADNKLIVTDGDCLLHSLLYALGKTTEPSDPGFMGFHTIRAKIVNHFIQLMGDLPGLQIDSVPVKESRNSDKNHFLGEDALKTTCLLYKTNILVVSLQTETPQVRFFYHPDHTPNKIIHLVNIGKHYLPVSVIRTGDVVLSDHVVSVTLLELIVDRLKHPPLVVGGDIGEEVFINPEYNPQFGEIIELMCHLSVFERNLQSQIDERLRVNAGPPPRPKSPPRLRSPPRYPNRTRQFEEVVPLAEIENFLRERTLRGVSLKTLVPSDLEEKLQKIPYVEFANAISSMEKYRDDILNNYMRYKSIEAGGNEDIDTLRQDIIHTHKPKLEQVDRDIEHYQQIHSVDQEKMNEIINDQYNELKALDDDLEVLIGSPNARNMPSINTVLGRKASLAKPKNNLFGNIKQSVRNAKQKRIQNSKRSEYNKLANQLQAKFNAAKRLRESRKANATLSKKNANMNQRRSIAMRSSPTNLQSQPMYVVTPEMRKQFEEYKASLKPKSPKSRARSNESFAAELQHKLNLEENENRQRQMLENENVARALQLTNNINRNENAKKIREQIESNARMAAALNIEEEQTPTANNLGLSANSYAEAIQAELNRESRR